MSKKVIGNLTAAEMLAQIDAAAGPAAITDDEWKTTEEWAAAWRIPRATANKKIRVAVKAGLMLMQKHYRETLRGLYPTPVFKWVGSKPK